MELLSQQDPRWANIKLGTSAYYLWAKGCFLTEIAQAIGTTPDVVNEKLTALDGYADDGTGNKSLIIWDKIKEAFPEWTASYHAPYDNTVVVAMLGAGNKVLVEVGAQPIGGDGLHCTQYLGNAKCINCWPNPAVEVETSFFPDVKAFVVLTKVAVAEPVAPVESAAPVENPNIYKGLDLTNTDSVKAAIDTWKDVEDGVFVRKDAMPDAPIVTLSNLPVHEKEAVMNRIQNVSDDIKSLLGF